MEFVELKKHLKTEKPHACYACYGDDDFLIDRAVALLLALASEPKPFNCADREFQSARELTDELMQLPVMSDYRVVVARGKTDIAAVSEYLAKPNPTSVLVLPMYTPHDSWNRASAPSLPSGCTAVDCNRLPVKHVAPFVKKTAEQTQSVFDDDAISLLYNRCGGYMTRINSESQKLAMLRAGATVTASDVTENVKADTEFVVFELCDSILAGNSARALAVVDGMAERDIPLSVFHFDCFWMKENEWCGFEWDKDMFPDPEGMLKRLHEDKGLEVCVWINSYIGQQSKLFDIGKEKGYFIKNLDGSVFQCDTWQPGMAIVDFTNPEACEWFKGLLKKLFEMGVNNIKTDFGERIPTKCKYYNGMDPIKMHNYYTYLYNKVVFEALEEYYGKDKACLFARSATVGGQKFPVHWGGDCYADYSAMSETLHGGLSLCSSGFGFFSHDMGGFEATAPADIYKRWCAFGCLSTHSRLHGSTSYRVPWVYDDEACDVLRHYVVLKGKLMPYLWAQANKTHTEGVPMMRSMVIAFTGETACKYLDQQYMLGDNLCIAPVMNEAGIAEFYVPDCGTWTDIQSGEKYEGGKYYTRTCDYFQTPVLARPNSIVVFGNFDAEDKMTVVYDYLQDAEAVVYALEDGKTATASVFDSESNKITDITASRQGNVIAVSYAATDKSFKVTAEGKTVEAAAGSTSVEITL